MDMPSLMMRMICSLNSKGISYKQILNSVLRLKMLKEL